MMAFLLSRQEGKCVCMRGMAAPVVLTDMNVSGLKVRC